MRLSDFRSGLVPGCALAVLLAAPVLPSARLMAAEPLALEVVSIGSFEAGLENWKYNGGWEFKGAKGRLERDETGGRTGAAARLSADFSKGGSYVAMQRDLRRYAREIRLQVKAPDCTSVSLRLTDGAKQTFQYQVALKETADWQAVTLTDFEKAQNHFGGANDGQWHPPLRGVWIMLTSGSLKPGDKKGEILIDDIELAGEPVRFADPLPMPAFAPAPRDSIFGFSAHMLHNDLFYGLDKFDPYNRLEYTLPFVAGGGFGLMREGLYQGFFAGTNGVRNAANRKQVETYLGLYGKAGVRVLLCPLFSKVSGQGFTSYFEWLGQLSRDYPCVTGIEMHNEPNLKFFWGGSASDYAEACREGSRLVKAISPGTPIYIGSISHMWWGPGVKWLQDVLASGALDSADGLTVHPYRQGSPPEGGAMHAAADDHGGFASETAEWWAMIQRFNTNNRPLKLFFTEVGYSSGVGKAGLGGTFQSEGVGLERQADYISRLALLVFDMRLRGLPIHGLCWYDLKCDGEDPAGMEHNFGVVRYDAQAPRQAYLAYSRIAKTFGALADFLPLETTPAFSVHPEAVKSMAWQRLSDGALLVAFWRLDQVTTVTNDFDGDLLLNVPAGFEAGRVDQDDLRTERTSPLVFKSETGLLRVPVRATPRASWITICPRTPGAAVSSTAGDWHDGLPVTLGAAGGGAPQFTLAGPQVARLGASLPVSFTVDNASGTVAVAGALMMMGTETPFTAEAGQIKRVAIDLPAATNGAARVVWYAVRVGDRIAGRGGFTIRVEDALAFRAPPFVNGAGQLEVRLHNAVGGMDARVTQVGWTQAAAHGSTAIDKVVRPGGDAVLKAPFPALAPYQAQTTAVTVAVAERAALTAAGEIGFNPCPRLEAAVDGILSEWINRPAIDLTRACVLMEGYGGTNDLSGRIWIGHDATNFYLAAAMEDDVFCQKLEGDKVWKGDGFQFALAAPAAPGTEARSWNEFGLSLTPAGPQVWRWLGPDGVPKGLVVAARAVARREGRTTWYECAIPWKDLAPLAPADGLVAFSILYNDNDGKSRRGWIEWGSGIGRSKNPGQFRTCVLTD